jgi:hypothetical protein
MSTNWKRLCKSARGFRFACRAGPLPRAEPLAPLFGSRIKCVLIRHRASQGAGCGPGGPPHNGYVTIRVPQWISSSH